MLLDKITPNNAERSSGKEWTGHSNLNEINDKLWEDIEWYNKTLWNFITDRFRIRTVTTDHSSNSLPQRTLKMKGQRKRLESTA